MNEEKEFIIWLDGFISALGATKAPTDPYWIAVYEKMNEMKAKLEQKQLLND